MNADGSIEGADTDDDFNHYEPHYDVITEPGQVQIYEAIMQNSDGDVTHTLLRAASGLGSDKSRSALPDMRIMRASGRPALLSARRATGVSRSPCCDLTAR